MSAGRTRPYKARIEGHRLVSFETRLARDVWVKKHRKMLAVLALTDPAREPPPRIEISG